MTTTLHDILSDPRDLRDDSVLVTPEEAAHERALTLWAMQKPAMDLGLIPHEPKPVRPRRHKRDTANTRADALCKLDPTFIRPDIAAKEYGLSPSVLRAWYSYHKINAITIYDGTNAVTLFYRADIERALAKWVPGSVTQNDFNDDDGVPDRIRNAAATYRTDANPPTGGAADGSPVAAALTGQSRHCGNGRGLHGCEPDSLAPRGGKEQSRGASILSEVA
jgi:hypothetical protein